MGKIGNIELKKLEGLYKLNKLTELEKETKKLLQIENTNTILLNILGVVYLRKELFIEAEQIFKKILDQNSKDANALKNLGEVYRKLNKFSFAIKYYEFYLIINPNDDEVVNNIASCYFKNKRYGLAINYYRDLIKRDPQNEEYLTNLAFALINSLDIESGIEILEKVLDKNINNKRAYSGYLSNQNYNPNINLNKVNNYIKRFNQSYKKDNLNIIDFRFEKNPKEINIGFVSPDFRAHPVAYSITNVIKYLKLYNFKLFGYYNFNIEDNLTSKLKKDFNFFYNIAKLNNEQIINKIRSDGIHILIDLAGHSINNNLEIFYYNPAPIQISWLGSMTTTGIKEINYKIGDRHIFSETIEKNYSEKLLKLPNIWTDFVVYQDNNITTLVKENENELIIFGSFVSLKKINDSVIKLWSKVLKKFSNTKIYFKAPELNDVDIQKSLKKKFFDYDINSDRLILEGSSNHKAFLQSFSKAHISLDPFPWNGLTTSFESIWMGVPIFCLKGDNLVYSRCSYSINKNLKMDDWIANDENDYLTKLEKILSNKKKLLLIKKNLRENAIKNNLFNSKEFTKNFANILTKAWKDFTVE